MMILLAEFSTLPRTEIKTPYTNTTQKDFRPTLQNIKIIPEYPVEEKAKHQELVAKHLSGSPAPTNGPMAILSRMEEVHTTYLDQLDISIIEIPATWDADWLLEIVRKDPSVDYAGVDRSEYILPQADPPGIRPNDPYFGRQTNLHDPVHDVDVDAPEAWAYTTGSDNVVVAVLDTGIDITNLDLIPNLWRNSSEIANNNIDDDMNGCVDDIHGCNTITRNGNGMIEDERGRQFHGTGVSSILGARGNDN
ncbi:MAG: S8 family serine peptidase, partial [Gammaproteobacteria bacterium]|nr:S8 family serine peptidase [Gammaproteobacteria bacterium]